MQAMRLSLNEPINEIFEAAAVMSQAADAHLAGDSRLAGELLRKANSKTIWDYVDAGWGKGSRARYAFSELIDAPPYLPVSDRPKPRMPTSATKLAVKKRDKMHCRLCSIPLIDPEVRRRLVSLYPNEVGWPRTDQGKHAALTCMWLQYDHILPNSRGGDSCIDNVVLTCTVCNYGRMDSTLEEGRLAHPLTVERVRWSSVLTWDGLERLMAAEAERA